jgi:hypothetical protein
MINISLCAAGLWKVVVAVQETAGPVAVVEQVGSMMIKSPGAAKSIASWIDCDAETCVGAGPPIVMVTASIDCLWLSPLVMTN